MKESNTYHNTTNQDIKFVNKAIRKCNSQELRVMAIMNARKQLGASEVWKVYQLIYPDCPLTSIRRALSNLAYDGKLIKKEKTTQGIYGRPECLYALPFKK